MARGAVAALAAPYAVYAVLDVLLLPAVAAVLLDVLLRAGNKRNLPLGAILALLALANLCFHLAVLGIVDLQPMRALFAALALIVMIECVMAGRVLPFFTMSATPGLKLDEKPWLVKATLATSAIALVLWVFAPAGPITALAFALAAACHLLRQWSWQPWVTRRAHSVDPACGLPVAADRLLAARRRAVRLGHRVDQVHALAVARPAGSSSA
jgi:uncharacterized protein involved in response to NO